MNSWQKLKTLFSVIFTSSRSINKTEINKLRKELDERLTLVNKQIERAPSATKKEIHATYQLLAIVMLRCEMLAKTISLIASVEASTSGPFGSPEQIVDEAEKQLREIVGINDSCIEAIKQLCEAYRRYFPEESSVQTPKELLT